MKFNKNLSEIKEELIKFLKIFGFFFVLTIILINMGTVKGIFDYKGIYKNVINPEEKTEITNQSKETPSVAKEIVIQPKETTKNFITALPEPVIKGNNIEIPKIEIMAPILSVKEGSNTEYDVALKKGVVMFFNSVLPGKIGQTIILGHSAPSGWPKINYDWVFSKLNELETGDKVFINYENKKYEYNISKKMFLNSGEEIPKSDLTNSSNVLLLISCWPPGVNQRRIAIEAYLFK